MPHWWVIVKPTGADLPTRGRVEQIVVRDHKGKLEGYWRDGAGTGYVLARDPDDGRKMSEDLHATDAKELFEQGS